MAWCYKTFLLSPGYLCSDWPCINVSTSLFTFHFSADYGQERDWRMVISEEDISSIFRAKTWYSGEVYRELRILNFYLIIFGNTDCIALFCRNLLWTKINQQGCSTNVWSLGRKFSRAGPIPRKLVWRKTTPKLVKNTLNWLQNPPKLEKGRWN